MRSHGLSALGNGRKTAFGCQNRRRKEEGGAMAPPHANTCDLANPPVLVRVLFTADRAIGRTR
jgi:hypothetical protein